MKQNTLQEGGMDVLVMLEENPDHSRVLAHVNSCSSPLASNRPARDIVTLYGVPNVESLALALAAAVESHRRGEGHDHQDAIRHLGVWAERGAVGDAAWRDERTGQLLTEDLEIPAARLRETALGLLTDTGSLIRQMVAGLLMPDWPEGVRRAINFSFTPSGTAPAFAGSAFAGAAAGMGADALLDSLREADGNLFEGD
jgi:hypothetical protein